jgi:hypothetical protein
VHVWGSVRSRVYGVDFSGAADAGARLWVARLAIAGGVAHVEWCGPALALPGGGRDRARALAALRALIADERDAAFGIDAPFALPAALMEAGPWAEFVCGVGARHPDADAFRAWCLAAAGRRELRRRTEREARTPFAAYNIRLYRQTYHALRDLLAPLVAADRARALPLQLPADGLPWLLEVCPASALKRAGRYRPYKGTTVAHCAARADILAWLADAHGLVLDAATRERVLANAGGDALDSLIAAAVTAAVLAGPTPHPAGDGRFPTEGWVYL